MCTPLELVPLRPLALLVEPPPPQRDFLRERAPPSAQRYPPSARRISRLFVCTLPAMSSQPARMRRDTGHCPIPTANSDTNSSSQQSRHARCQRMRFAAMASAGALCHSAMAASARAYSTALPLGNSHVIAAIFALARMRLLSHHTAVIKEQRFGGHLKKIYKSVQTLHMRQFVWITASSCCVESRLTPTPATEPRANSPPPPARSAAHFRSTAPRDGLSTSLQFHTSRTQCARKRVPASVATAR